MASAIGAGRALIGAGFLAAPVLSVRVLGLDTETAKRVTFLARMAAGRDIALGVGTLASARCGRNPAGWLLAGAVADATDAVVIAAAIREGRAGGLPGVGITLGAAAAAAAGVWAAVDVRRSG